MKAITTSLLALIMASFAFSVLADEPSQNETALLGLRERVQQLEERIRAIEGSARTVAPKKALPLADAVERFNARAAADAIGRTQPPLTVKEVVASIRWLGPDDVPVTSEEIKAYKTIADTHELPPGADLEVISTFIPSDKYKFQAWSVRLRMPRSAKQGWTYAFPIRQRWIASAPLTDSDRKSMRSYGGQSSRTVTETASTR